MNQSRRIFPNINILAALAASVVLIACRPEAEGNRGAAIDSAGEEPMGEWHGVELGDEIWKVGRMEGPEYEVLGKIADVTFVGTGLAVSDSHSDRIHWYDDSGIHRMSAGGSGGGPGEFVRVHSLDILPDGTLVAVDGGSRGIEFFGEDGNSTDHLLFPGSIEEMCLLDSTMVVLGTVDDSDLPLHLIDLADGSLASIGSTTAPESDSRNRGALVLGLLGGSIGCMADRIVYARSSDGMVGALDRDGSVLWEVEMPSFLAIVYEDDGERGIKTSAPEGATEFHVFHSVTRFGQTVAVQIQRISLGTRDVSISTVFLELASGEILGEDGSLPMIMAVKGDRIAVVREAPIPELAVYSFSHR